MSYLFFFTDLDMSNMAVFLSPEYLNINAVFYFCPAGALENIHTS